MSQGRELVFQEKISKRIVQEFHRRTKLNPRYSKAAYARSLGMSYTFVRQLMDGKRRVTRRVAEKLVQKIPFPPQEKGQVLKEAKGSFIFKETRSNFPKEFQKSLHLSDLLVLEATETKKEGCTEGEIQDVLRFPSEKIRKSLKKLKDAHLLFEGKRGVWKKTKEKNHFFSETPSLSILSFQDQFLNQVRESIHFDSPEERMCGTVNLAFHPKDLPEVRKMWRKFRDELLEKFGGSNKKTEVYGGFFAFVPLIKKEKGKKK